MVEDDTFRTETFPNAVVDKDMFIINALPVIVFNNDEFVKNVFKNYADSPKKTEDGQNRFIRLSEKVNKRELTPAKKRNSIKQSKVQ